MEKKILGIIIIFILLLILFNKESFITTGFDKIIKNKQVVELNNEDIVKKNIETTDNVPSLVKPSTDISLEKSNLEAENIRESGYFRIIGTFIGILIFVYCIVKYKTVIHFIKNIPTNVNNLFKSDNDLIDDDYSFGGKMLYLGGYDINDYSD